MTDGQPRVGYIGLDHHHAEPYLETLSHLPVDVTSVCEPATSFDPSDVAPANTARYRDPLALMDEEEPDILWLTLSNRETPSIIRAAVDRGIDVYTEKPVARTADELEPLIEHVATSTASVAVSFTWRGHPVAQELKARAAAGFFGDVRSIETRFHASQVRYRNANHHLFDVDASRGGILQWLGVHWVDLIPWMLGDAITHVHARTTTHPDLGIDEGASLQFGCRSGATGTMSTGYYLREGRYDTYLGVTGTAGRAAWDPMGEYFGFEDETTLELERNRPGHDSAPRRELTYEYHPLPGYGGAYGRAFMAQFLEARTDPDVSLPADLTEALAALRVLDAAYASADGDGWTSVETELE